MDRFKYLFPVLFTTMLTGCFNVRVSELRPPVPYKTDLPNDISLVSEGPVILMNKNFYPASFRLEANGKIIYIDPFMIQSPVVADFIFITHSHFDHFSKKDIKKITGQHTLIVGPFSVTKKIRTFKTASVKPGYKLELDGITCEAVPSYNTEPVFLWIKGHPKRAEFVGYILTINGTRIYHGGDTGLIPEMKEFENITVALVPVGGDNLTMSVEEGAEMVNFMKPQIAIPMHYEAGQNATIRFAELVDRDIKVIIFE